MRRRPYNLAIETSSLPGSCSLGYCDRLIASIHLADPPEETDRSDRRACPQDLMVAIDHLTRTHQVDQTQLGQIYLSIGPGSFTGLRIAVTTAKAMATFLDVQLVAVPSVAIVAQNVPTCEEDAPHLAVCLSHKRDTAYVQLFRRLACQWQRRGPASVCDPLTKHARRCAAPPGRS